MQRDAHTTATFFFFFCFFLSLSIDFCVFAFHQLLITVDTSLVPFATLFVHPYSLVEQPVTVRNDCMTAKWMTTLTTRILSPSGFAFSLGRPLSLSFSLCISPPSFYSTLLLSSRYLTNESVPDSFCHSRSSLLHSQCTRNTWRFGMHHEMTFSLPLCVRESNQLSLCTMIQECTWLLLSFTSLRQ